MKKNNFFLSQCPEVQKIYTTNEVAQLLNCTAATVRSIVYYHHLDYSVRPTSKTKESFYYYDTYRQIKEIHEKGRASYKAKQAIKKTETAYSLEEMQAAHPLVKDLRFFRLTYFPDTTPKCFLDLDE